MTEEQKEKEVDIEKLKGNDGGKDFGVDEFVDREAQEEEDTGIKVEGFQLMDDVDIDSGNDNLDYHLDKLQIIVSKKDIENFIVS